MKRSRACEDFRLLTTEEAPSSSSAERLQDLLAFPSLKKSRTYASYSEEEMNYKVGEEFEKEKIAVSASEYQMPWGTLRKSHKASWLCSLSLNNNEEEDFLSGATSSTEDLSLSTSSSSSSSPSPESEEDDHDDDDVNDLASSLRVSQNWGHSSASVYAYRNGYADISSIPATA